MKRLFVLMIFLVLVSSPVQAKYNKYGNVSSTQSGASVTGNLSVTGDATIDSGVSTPFVRSFNRDLTDADVLTASDAGNWTADSTSAIHVELPSPTVANVGLPFKICRENTGGVSVFITSGSIGKSGTTVYSHASTDTDACAEFEVWSGNSYFVTPLNGTWSIK